MKTDELKQEVVRWVRREVELTRQREAIEAEVGAAMVDAKPGASGDVSERAANEVAKLRAVTAALRETQRRRMEAIRANRAAELTDLEERRAAVEEEHAALAAKVEKFKKAFTDLLGVEIVLVTASPGMLSRLQRLEGQIGNLTEQALSVQNDAIPSAGTVDVQDATSVEALVDELALFEGAIPAMQSVLDWANSCEPVPGESFGQLPRRFRLVWANGEIDREQSSIFVGELCRPGHIATYSDRPRGIDVKSGTFRAPAAVPL
jgi:hypothetical protein